MKFKIVIATFGIFSLHKEILGSGVDAKSVQNDFNDDIVKPLRNCSQVNSESDCFLDEGEEWKNVKRIQIKKKVVVKVAEEKWEATVGITLS